MRRLVVTDSAEGDFSTISEYIAEASGSRHIAEGLVERLYYRC